MAVGRAEYRDVEDALSLFLSLRISPFRPGRDASRNGDRAESSGYSDTNLRRSYVFASNVSPSNDVDEHGEKHLKKNVHKVYRAISRQQPFEPRPSKVEETRARFKELALFVETN